MMEGKTWTYGGYELIVRRGLVVASNCVSYPVGTKLAPGQLRACGWRTPKRVVQYDAFGRRVG